MNNALLDLIRQIGGAAAAGGAVAGAEPTAGAAIAGAEPIAGAIAGADPAAAICRALDIQERPLALGANDAFPLDGRENVWLLLAGSLDLFYLTDGPRLASQRLQGVRHHMMRVEAGGIAFGLTDEGSRNCVLAVPGPGTELVATTREPLFALLSGGVREATAVEAAIIGWVAGLAVNPNCRKPPREAVLLAEDKSVELAAGKIVLPSTRSVWVEAPSDAFALADDTEIPGVDAGLVRLPVADRWWLKARRDIVITPVAPEVWLHEPDIASDLDLLHGLALTVVADAARHEVERAQQRVVERRQHVQADFRGALRSLVGVIPGTGAAAGVASADASAAAVGLAARQLGMELVFPRGLIERLTQSKDPVTDISQAVGIRCRQISLPDQWWRRELGPLVGYYGDTRRPCALLPQSPRQYRLVDPTTGYERLVDTQLAKNVATSAHSFSPPLPPGQLPPWQLLKFGFGKASRDAWIIVAIIVLNGLLSLVTPIVTGWVMDPVIPQGEVGQLAVLIAALLVAGLATAGFSQIQSIATIRIQGLMAQRVQGGVWDRLLNLPASFFRGYAVGDLANRAQGIDSMREMMTGALTSTLMSSVSGIFSFGLMFYYSWQLALVTGFVGLVYIVVVYFIGRRVLSRNRDMMRMTGALQGLVLQLLAGVPRLRVTNAERNAFAIWAARYSELLSITFHQTNLNNAVAVFKAVFNYLGLIAIFGAIGYFGGVLFAIFHQPLDWKSLSGGLLQAGMPIGHFVAFYAAYGQYLAAVFGVTQVAIQLINLRPLYERVTPILQASPERQEGGDEDPGDIEGDIEVRDVYFRYAPELPLVLNGLTLRAQPGQFVALVGPSGAGKSSLVRLLLGFEQPESGSLFIDGKDIRNLDKRALRRNFGVVLQNGRVLSGSIFHNITAGANLTREDAWDAARIAGLDRDIDQMPMGMDTFLSEGAGTISGGQRQRLMIARAIARRPRILIFDEATSALDNETQALVARGLESLKCTRVVIAHRLSTIIDADFIYVLTAGSVIEGGNYAELIAKDGVFAELARRQIA